MDSPPVVVVSIVGVALAITAISAQPKKVHAPACAVALAFTQQQYHAYDRKIAVGEQPMFQAPTARELTELLAKRPQFKSDPELPILWQEVEVRNIRPQNECPELRKWLQINNILYEDKKILPLIVRKDGGPKKFSPFTVITLTMPVISGNRAFLYAGYACGSTCGSAAYVELRRNPGESWLIFDEATFGVS